jgi:uracil-DNA glycosylase family 4
MTPENARGAARGRSDDAAPKDIEDAYLRRAIAEMGALNDEIASVGPDPDGLLPVMASGSPQAEIALVKWAPSPAERQEGVAFFGRSGSAVLKSVQRLDIDPLRLFGTIVVKHGPVDREATPRDLGWLERELRIVAPKIVVAMGERVQSALDALEMPLAAPLSGEEGVVGAWTPSTEVLPVPDIDASLDEQAAKRAFWNAFRALGDWHREQPPY